MRVNRKIDLVRTCRVWAEVHTHQKRMRNCSFVARAYHLARGRIAGDRRRKGGPCFWHVRLDFQGVI